jgi:hypothetical protein
MNAYQTTEWNAGKVSEWRERVFFDIKKTAIKYNI